MSLIVKYWDGSSIEYLNATVEDILREFPKNIYCIEEYRDGEWRNTVYHYLQRKEEV